VNEDLPQSPSNGCQAFSVFHLFNSSVFHAFTRGCVLLALLLIFANQAMAQGANAAQRPKDMSAPTKTELDAFLKQMDDDIHVSESRPEKLSDEEIVKYLGDTLKNPATGEERTLTMWDGPMRITAVRSDGRDIDLTTFSGIIFERYITALADFTGIPISLTKVADHDNNASVIIGSPQTGNPGALYGVPELADYVSKPANGLMGIEAHNLEDIRKNDPQYIKRLSPEDLTKSLKKLRATSSHEGHAADMYDGTYVVGHTIKGAVLEITLPLSSFVGHEGMLKAYRHSAESIIGFYRLPQLWVHLLDVEAPQNPRKPWFKSPFTAQYKGPDMSLIGPSHLFYFWRLEHNAGVTPGMDRKTFEKTISDYLKQHPGE
jgi:hypothetical protein